MNRRAMATAVFVIVAGTSALAVNRAVADAPGKVPLTTAVSYLPWEIGIVGADAADVVTERVNPNTPGSYPTQPLVAGSLGGGPGRELAVDSSGEVHGVAGTAAVSYEYGDYTYHWQDLVTGTTGTGNVILSAWAFAFGPHGGTWIDLVSVGGVETVHLFRTDIEQGNVVDLGPLPGITGPNRVQILDSPNEIDVLAYNDGVIDRVVPGGATTSVAPPGGLDPLICTSVTTDAVGCYGQNSVVRLPLDGSAPISTAIDSTPATVAVTPEATAWVTDRPGTGVVMASVPAAGGPVSTSALTPGLFFGMQSLVSAGDRFLLVAGSTLDDAGVYSVADATDTGTLILAAGARPIVAAELAMTSGRVAWTSDRTDLQAVDSRLVTSNGSAAGLGSTTELAPASGFGTPLSASAALTAFTVPSTSQFDALGTPLNIIEVAGPDGVNVIDTVDGPALLQLSGNRLLYARINPDNTITPLLRDLAHHTTTNLSTLGVEPHSTTLALWGNYLVWAKADNSIWRKDLSTGITSEVVPPLPYIPIQVFAWGDWVGWTDGTGGERVDAAHHGVVEVLPGPLQALTSDGALVETASGVFLSSGQVGLVPYGSTAVTPIADDAVLGQIGENDSIAAWIDSSGMPWVVALPPLADQPRLLGDPSTPTLPSSSDGNWHADIPTSAPVSSCTLRIMSGSTVVRTVGCDPVAAKQGDIRLRWDLVEGSGLGAPPGQYSWSVEASNAAGPVLNPAGTASATLTGTLYVPSAVVIVSSPTSKAVVVGHAATFTAAASGVPTPTAQWQRSTDGGKTWSNIASAVHPTYTFTATAGENGYRYRAVFSNGVGISPATAAARLTVYTPPVVTRQPLSVRASAGQSVAFTAAASGRPTPTVQWQVSSDGGRTWVNVSGATSTTLRVTARTSLSGHRYRARFHNVAGSAYSRSVTLSVA